MREERKFLIKVWSFALAFGLASSYIISVTESSYAILLIRLLGSCFIGFLYMTVRSRIQKVEKQIKESHGFMNTLFDPYILKLTLQLSLIGWTAFSIMEYLGLNKVDWILLFMLAISIMPFSLGLIPLRMPKEDWRRKK